MNETQLKQFVDAIGDIAHEIHAIAREHGWWEQDRNFGEMIALMHSELSEALEYDRKGNKPSDHIPDFSGVEEEFADVIIRILDTSHQRGFCLGEVGA